jgi:DNA-binding beta-propeller fold protein YncE
MKSRIVIGVSLIVVVLAMANLFVSHAQQAVGVSAAPPAGNGAPPLLNPLKVALLKWYNANVVPTEFPAGPNPVGVAFDGANIWIANYGASTVTKLRASDGQPLGSFHSGNAAAGVTFDGADIWVTNSTDNTVSKLRASDGKLLGTFPLPGVVPWWMTFDGANIWVPSSNANGNGWVTKLRASDGKNLGNFQVGGSPLAAAFDGANVWVTNSGSNTVMKLRASDGTVLGTFAAGQPFGICFDGANMWDCKPRDCNGFQATGQ